MVERATALPCIGSPQFALALIEQVTTVLDLEHKIAEPRPDDILAAEV